MTLVANWRRVLSRAWSVRFIFLAGGMSALEFILQTFGESLPIPTRAYTLLTGLTIGAAFVARLVPSVPFRRATTMPVGKIAASRRGQAAVAGPSSLRPPAAGQPMSRPSRTSPRPPCARGYRAGHHPAGGGARHRSPHQALGRAGADLALGSLREDLGHLLRRDPDQREARHGRHAFTKTECDQMLARRVIADYYLPLVDGVPAYLQAPDSVQATLLSGAYNFGAPAARRSTAARPRQRPGAMPRPAPLRRRSTEPRPGRQRTGEASRDGRRAAPWRGRTVPVGLK